jgi:hypothetical protein
MPTPTFPLSAKPRPGTRSEGGLPMRTAPLFAMLPGHSKRGRYSLLSRAAGATSRHGKTSAIGIGITPRSVMSTARSYLTPQVISCLSVPVSGLPPAHLHPFAYAPTDIKTRAFRILVSLQFPYPPKSCRKHLTKPLFIKDSTTKRVLTAGTHISASPERARFVLTAFS